MRILILTDTFQYEQSGKWLFDDLADALIDAGVEVWVVVASATVPRPRRQYSPRVGLHVVSVGVEKIPHGRRGRVYARIAAAMRMRAAVRSIPPELPFDGVIFSSISLLVGRSAELLPAQTHKIHVMWDFFPIHHYQIGSLPSPRWLLPVLQRLERWAIGRPDTVLTMSEAGREFFDEYHLGLAERFAIQAPWSPDTTHRVLLDKSGPMSVIFGGQLAPGRGVDSLIRAAALLQDSGPPIRLFIAGRGNEEASLRDLADRLGARNVVFLGHLDRAEYLQALLRAHVGVAITDAHVKSPSFPSKIGDYARVGLPVMIATETNSDVGTLIESLGAGLAAIADDPAHLARTIASFEKLRADGHLQEISRRSRALFENHMSADRAARTVIECAGSADFRNPTARWE